MSNVEKLTDYERGYLDALYRFAWWKDGEMFVGTMGRTYRTAKAEMFKLTRGENWEKET